MESKGLMEHDLKSNKIHVLVLITNAKIVKNMFETFDNFSAHLQTDC